MSHRVKSVRMPQRACHPHRLDKWMYTYAKTGARNVDHMKQLAVNGRELNSFINTNPAVRNGYARKER